MIDRYLTGRRMQRITRVKLPEIYVAPVAVDETDATPVRVSPPHLPVAARRHTFAEVELAVDEAAARCEARRCLRCDLEFTQGSQAIQ
jgi:hypothetical protein